MNFKHHTKGNGVMPQQLRQLAAFSEEPSSVSSMHHTNGS